jgi:hypothetical protein
MPEGEVQREAAVRMLVAASDCGRPGVKGQQGERDLHRRSVDDGEVEGKHARSVLDLKSLRKHLEEGLGDQGRMNQTRATV